jgi:hypothetical protein
VLIAFLLSNANPAKEDARRYLKEKLDGWKERIALAVFDAAWDAAIAAVGTRVGSLAPHAGDAFAQSLVDADRQQTA